MTDVDGGGAGTGRVFWHAGLPKTGSTYLQRQVLPAVRGIAYVRRHEYPRAAERIEQKKREADVVYSRELDRGLVAEADRLSRSHPEARPILVLRRHDELIASLYRYGLKHGRGWAFREFFDLDGDRGRKKQNQLRMRDKIELLADRFRHPPFLLFYDELRDRPDAFLRRLIGYLGEDPDSVRIPRAARNRSPREKQLKYARRLGARLLPERRSRRYPVRRLYGRVAYHAILGAARWLPEGPIREEPLIDPAELARIREAYADDWQFCLDYAERTNPVLEAAGEPAAAGA